VPRVILEHKALLDLLVLKELEGQKVKKEIAARALTLK
jgi:hypothetical protein